MFLSDGMPVVPVRYYGDDPPMHYDAGWGNCNYGLITVGRENPLQNESMRHEFESEQYCLLRGCKYYRHNRRPYWRYIHDLIHRYARMKSKYGIVFLNIDLVGDRFGRIHASTRNSINDSGDWEWGDGLPPCSFHGTYYLKGKKYHINHLPDNRRHVMQKLYRELLESNSQVKEFSAYEDIIT